MKVQPDSQYNTVSNPIIPNNVDIMCTCGKLSEEKIKEIIQWEMNKATEEENSRKYIHFKYILDKLIK